MRQLLAISYNLFFLSPVTCYLFLLLSVCCLLFAVICYNRFADT